MEHSATALVVATMDTKGQESLYIANCLKGEGIAVILMDAGIRGTSPIAVDVSRQQVARAGGSTLEKVQSLGHEGDALQIMAAGAVKCAQDLQRENKINGVIGLGGSMGTTLGTGVMRSFAVGFPKVMISTMASRDTRAFVGTKDIFMLHSVCDLAGLNRITRKVLRNGALALAGMLQAAPPLDEQSEKPLVFVSTLGTTEACVQQVRMALEEKNNEVVIFHTVGAGGKAMEEMIGPEKVSALVDLSLHEIADHHFGGDYDAGPERGTTALKKGIPTILVPGNIDFLVTGPLETARRQFADRPYHEHNAAITVVRTSREEMQALGKIIAGLCNRASGPCRIMVPMKGFSAFDHEKGPLHDPEAPEIFQKILQQHLDDKSCLQALPLHINDAAFSRAIVDMSLRISSDLA